jgi:REP element-mobilizing transposase RayT
MDSIGRKTLPHDGGPLFPASAEGEVYFITICCVPRGKNQLACPEVWGVIEETIMRRVAAGDLTCRLALAMPDHFHALMGFPGEVPMRKGVRGIRSWLARQAGIRWQRDFFDHRLRGRESAAEKAEYIRLNPVRAGLVERPDDWPYRFCQG